MLGHIGPPGLLLDGKGGLDLGAVQIVRQAARDGGRAVVLVVQPHRIRGEIPVLGSRL